MAKIGWLARGFGAYIFVCTEHQNKNIRFNNEEQLATTSLAVAKAFGKMHKHVLRDIRALIEADNEFGRTNFGPSTYLNEQKHKQPMYLMTRDGFSLLVMGYTGELAMQFKVAYIRAFSRMEKLLVQKRIERAKGKAVRRALTDVIQEIYGIAAKDMNPNPYAKYTEMVYLAAFGKRTWQLKEMKGLEKKDNLRDHLSPEELAAVSKVEKAIGVGLELGWDDAQVTAFLRDNLKKPVLMLDATEETNE